MIPSALISTRHEYWSLFHIYAPIAIAVCGLIFLFALGALVIYRRRPHAARWHENSPLESSYAVLLCAVAAFLLYITYHYEHRVDTVANREQPALTINVTGARWEWQFVYPRYGIVRRSGTVGDETLVVPTNEPIRFTLTSIDVIHAFWVPELEFKHDVFPGVVQSQTLTFTRAGTFKGQCAVFCGLRHPEMIFTTQAMSPSAFAAWANAHRGSTS